MQIPGPCEKARDLGLGRDSYRLKMHSGELKENKITVNGSIKNKGGTSLFVSVAVATDTKVDNEIENGKESIVKVMVNNSCGKDKKRKDEDITEQRTVLDK